MPQHGDTDPRSAVDKLIASDRVPANANTDQLTEADIWAILEDVKDPEVPAVSVVELGIVRAVHWDGKELSVDVTPTYSGCPATELIEELIEEALRAAGFRNVRINQVLTPAWTTDWITDEGKEKLRAFGIAPPQGSASKRSLLGDSEEITCPHCGSTETERVSEFGSTACKALYRCKDCLEPFDYFKCI